MNQKIHLFKAEFFKTLAHPARLAILEHLRTGEKSVGELVKALDTDQSTVSQQLARLRSGNIVSARKVGTTVYYSVPDPLLFDLMDTAREIFNNQLLGTQETLRQIGEKEEDLPV